MRRIAVIGTGYVGLVSGTCFAEIGNQVTCCDMDQVKMKKLNQGVLPIYEPGLEELVQRNRELGRLSFTTDVPNAIREAEVIYIAVGTPMSKGGAADLSFVESVARTIGEHLNGYKVIVNKSTVPVGTGRRIQNIIQSHLSNPNIEFDVVSNPEFLREGSAVKDCMNMERAVIGASSEKAAALIAELHKPFHTQIQITSLESAEMVKYASNTFLATKISFINAIANISERVGADVTEVAKGMGMDSRIGSKFLQAGIGYGGSCFPKDTHALVHIAETVGYDFQLLKSVIEINEQQQTKVVATAKQVLGSLKGTDIAVLGLSYKPNTNDIREAPSLRIIPALLKEGVTVRAYDPIALEEASHHFGEQISYYTDLYEALHNADAAIIVTEWESIKHLNLREARRLLKTPIIIDGRNCFTLEEMRQAGMIYHSVGRPAVHAISSTDPNEIRKT